jgi:hypothetical protein
MTPMKTIRLYHPHTHEGVAYTPPPEGIALNVNDADAAFLDALGLTTPPPKFDDTSTAPTDVNSTDIDHDARVVATDQENTDA